jgi:hypothetical protein
VYIATIKNPSGKISHLLRHSYRENGKVKTKTIANLTSWPEALRDNLKAVLKGAIAVDEKLYEDSLVVKKTSPCGHVDAILRVMELLGLPTLLDPEKSKDRDIIVALIVGHIIVALIVGHIIDAASKIKTFSWAKTCTLADKMGIKDVKDEEIYKAMDWLYERQHIIEERLAERHITDGDLIFVDMTSVYYEGEKSAFVADENTLSGTEDEGHQLIRFG